MKNKAPQKNIRIYIAYICLTNKTHDPAGLVMKPNTKFIDHFKGMYVEFYKRK